MLTLARAALYAVIPAELVVVVLLLSGITLPAAIGLTVEIVALAALVLLAVAGGRVFRAHRREQPRRAALTATYCDLVPDRVRRIVGFDACGTVSLVRWALRRRHGVPAGATPVPYAGAQTPTMLLFGFAMLVELVGADLLLRHFGAPDALRVAILVIDGYSLLVVLAVVAACITRPHVISDDEIRIRYGAFFDVRIPRDRIASLRRVSNMDEKGLITVEGDELAVVVASQTNLIAELTQPVTAIRPLGRPAEVRTIRWFADDPSAALQGRRIRSS